MSEKAEKFLKNKQKGYFKEFEVYATDDAVISEWIEEYHMNCVMENTLNDAVLGTASEDEMLRKLWLDIINRKLDGAVQSYDATNFANDIIMSYRMTFIDYIPPPPPMPYIPPQQVAQRVYNGDDAMLEGESDECEADEYDAGFRR